MRAKDIMTTPVVTVSPSTSLKDVAALLVEYGISAVPVVDDTGDILGIVSEADLVGLQSIADPRLHAAPADEGDVVVPLTAEELMSADVMTVTEEEDVTAVARMMLDRAVKRIPVVSGRKVTGIISRREIMKVLARSDASIDAEVSQKLAHERSLIGPFTATVAGGVVTLEGPADERARELAELVVRSTPGVTAVRFAEPR